MSDSNFVNRFALTTSYITIIPLSRWLKCPEITAENYQQALAGLSKYLPAVGMLIGGILCGVYCLLNLALGITAGGGLSHGYLGPDERLSVKELFCGVIITVVWLTTTGALHFDGLMDTADGIFSHRDRSRMLEIMQDSRVGNFGAITGIAAFCLKATAIACISPRALPLVLFLTPVWSRLAEAYAIGRWPYARPDGKGKIWHDTTKMPDVFIAAILPIIVTVIPGIVLSEMAFVTAIFACLSGLAAGTYLYARLGGHTGDTYGAVVESCETLTLVALAMFNSGLFR